MFPALLTTLLFSISGVAANRTSRMLGGTQANFWRILLAALFLGILANKFGSGLQGPALPTFFVSGIVGFGIGDLALYQALPRIGSRLSIMLVHCLAAPFAAVAEWLWLGNRISSLEALSSAVILLGVAVALAPSEHLHLPRRTLWIGILMGTIAAFGQGFGAVISRKAYELCREAGFHMDGITAAYQRIWGGLLVAILSMVWIKLRRREPTAPREWKRILPWLLANVACGPALGVACYQWALGVERTAIVLPIVALTPLMIIPFSWHLEGERPTLRSLLGGVVAVAGVLGLTLVRVK
ncbi:MAG TPA: DMT family transporter [Verrucomicrobiae bacterium]|nr:DMT family transporter [Verrucomicrobiae bacterium]